MLDGQVSDAVEAREGIVNTLDLPSILVKVKKLQVVVKKQCLIFDSKTSSFMEIIHFT